MLITRLAALAEAVAGLRQSQQRAAQAASALSAAQRLRAASTRVTPAGGSAATRTAAGLADAGFPVMPGPVPEGSPAPAPRRPAPPVPKPTPRPRR